jgi:alanine transaminase
MLPTTDLSNASCHSTSATRKDMGKSHLPSSTKSWRSWNTPLIRLAEAGRLAEVFPKDAVARARSLLQSTGSVGAYSSNYRFQCVPESVAAYISNRDGFPSSPDDIFLTCGAFEGMLVSMTLLSGNHMRYSDERVGDLWPIPFYPVYRALLVTLDLVHYLLPP